MVLHRRVQREDGPWGWLWRPALQDQCRGRVVTVDVLPSQLGLPWEKPSKVDRMLLRAASVKSRWALCIMAVGHFFMGPYTYAVSGNV
jgi:hypothetical protein